MFFRERALLADNAFQLMEVINEESLKVYYYRFTSILFQILPLFALKLSLPFKWVLLGYSVSFIFVYTLIYHILVHHLQNDYLGWIFVSYFSLMVFDSFYFPIAELQIGVGFLLLFFALLLRYPAPKNFKILSSLLILIFPIVFIHRLLFLFFLFLMVFFLLYDSKFWNKYILFLLVFSFAVLLLHMQSFTTWYDASKQEDFIRNLSKYYPKYWELPSNTTFLENSIKFYYFFPLLLIGVIIGYLFSFIKKATYIKFPLLKLMLVLGFSFFYLLLLHIGSPSTFYQFYHESHYLPLTLIVTIPFLFDFIPNHLRSKYLLYIFATILFIRLNTIYNNHTVYTERLDWISEQLNRGTEQGVNKTVIHYSKVPSKKQVMEWAMPYESLLLSKLNGDQYLKTLFIPNAPNQYYENLNETNWFFTVFKKHDIDEYLNQKHLPLKKGKYIILD